MTASTSEVRAAAPLFSSEWHLGAGRRSPVSCQVSTMGMLSLLLLGLATSPDAGATTTPPPAEPTPEVRALVERMQGFYEKTQDFTAAFRQDYAYKTFGRTVTSTGTVAFKKPAQMRWDDLTPQKRSFVLSG